MSTDTPGGYWWPCALCDEGITRTPIALTSGRFAHGRCVRIQRLGFDPRRVPTVAAARARLRDELHGVLAEGSLQRRA